MFASTPLEIVDCWSLILTSLKNVECFGLSICLLVESIHRIRACKVFFAVHSANSELSSKPGEPQCAGTAKNSVTLSWEPPKNGKDMPIDGYVVETREFGSTAWTKYVSPLNTSTVHVDTVCASFCSARVSYSIRKYYFTEIIVNWWNSLQHAVVNS